MLLVQQSSCSKRVMELTGYEITILCYRGDGRGENENTYEKQTKERNKERKRLIALIANMAMEVLKYCLMMNGVCISSHASTYLCIVDKE
jgi:hypothetical protein